jgi:outer membrane murein-binding lipoprotein Lpp
MFGKIFINYRREDSTGTAGRLHDRIAQAFGQKNLFVDVVGVDLKGRLKNQVTACQAFLTVIGPNWLGAKDETTGHRINRRDDFIALEIATALAHNIPIIPVLVDGACMPTVSELPEALKPLARCQAVEVRRIDFDRDANALVERIRDTLSNKAIGGSKWRVRMLAGAVAVAVLILIGTGSYTFVQHISGQRVQQTELNAEAPRRAADAEASRNVAEAEKQGIAKAN